MYQISNQTSIILLWYLSFIFGFEWVCGYIIYSRKVDFIPESIYHGKEQCFLTEQDLSIIETQSRTVIQAYPKTCPYNYKPSCAFHTLGISQFILSQLSQSPPFLTNSTHLIKQKQKNKKKQKKNNETKIEDSFVKTNLVHCSVNKQGLLLSFRVSICNSDHYRNLSHGYF